MVSRSRNSILALYESLNGLLWRVDILLFLRLLVRDTGVNCDVWMSRLVNNKLEYILLLFGVEKPLGIGAFGTLSDSPDTSAGAGVAFEALAISSSGVSTRDEELQGTVPSLAAIGLVLVCNLWRPGMTPCLMAFTAFFPFCLVIYLRGDDVTTGAGI